MELLQGEAIQGARQLHLVTCFHHSKPTLWMILNSRQNSGQNCIYNFCVPCKKHLKTHKLYTHAHIYMCKICKNVYYC